jgi:hypothetical protein
VARVELNPQVTAAGRVSGTHRLGHGNFSITLNVYGGYIPQDEGGKAAPLAAPVAPAVIETGTDTQGRVLQFRPRRTG